MLKDFNRWNQKKKALHKSTFTAYVHEREVWWSALGANIGVEADGKHENFERPVLVLMKFSKDAVLVVPLSSSTKPNPYYYPFWHNGRLFQAIFSQIRLISTKRLLRRIYRMNRDTFDEIKTVILVMIRKF